MIPNELHYIHHDTIGQVAVAMQIYFRIESASLFNIEQDVLELNFGYSLLVARSGKTMPSH